MFQRQELCISLCHLRVPVISESHNPDPYMGQDFLKEDLAKAQRVSILIYLFKKFCFSGFFK